MRTIYVDGERDRSVNYVCPGCRRQIQGLECPSCEHQIVFGPQPFGYAGPARSPLSRWTKTGWIPDDGKR
jgi:DNA-directed RNA polymerase subunit RPC12/RpoP